MCHRSISSLWLGLALDCGRQLCTHPRSQADSIRPMAPFGQPSARDARVRGRARGKVRTLFFQFSRHLGGLVGNDCTDELKPQKSLSQVMPFIARVPSNPSGSGPRSTQCMPRDSASNVPCFRSRTRPRTTQGQFLFGDEFNRINELSRDPTRHQIRLSRSKNWLTINRLNKNRTGGRLEQKLALPHYPAERLPLARFSSSANCST